jgi:hypothetical protein
LDFGFPVGKEFVRQQLWSWLLERSGLLAKPQFPVVLINANKKNFYAGSSARNTFASTAAIGAVAAQ